MLRKIGNKIMRLLLDGCEKNNPKKTGTTVDSCSEGWRKARHLAAFSRAYSKLQRWSFFRLSLVP
jgi:hypothetical protein